MQILFARGVEHGVETDGCDEWPGVVERLQAPVVPHMGWNTVEAPEGSVLFDGVEDERFYFVHSYGVRRWELETHGRTRAPLVTWAEHGGDRFVAAVENGPLSATQFHPEKSGDAGAALLRNWVGCERLMSKERAQRRAEREREAAVKAAARAREAERRARSAARKRALTGWLPRSHADARHARRPPSPRGGRDDRHPASPSTCSSGSSAPTGRPASAPWSSRVLVAPVLHLFVRRP